MAVIFDYVCSECGETFEALTINASTPPDVCKKCGSITATFKKKLVGPKFIEGDTPGSRPATYGKNANKKIEHPSQLSDQAKQLG